MCGIFGIVYKKPTKLNKVAFNVMGIDNDSRGGDSCGIFIDGRYEYGVDKKKLYAHFYQESKVLNNTGKCTVALGHCRKASVGAINVSTAQPVIIKNTDNPSKVDFVLIHNGTIYNYKELAEKYIPEQDIKDLTDSQVLAKIFYSAGYDVLGEYRGGGVFVTVDYRSGSPVLRLFQGESKAYESSVNPALERPLYFVHNKEFFAFSSIGEFMPALFPFTTLMIPSPNMLIKLEDNKFSCEGTYDRSQCLQSKPVTVYTTPTTTTPPSSNPLSPYYADYYQRSQSRYNDVDDDPFGGSGTNVRTLGTYIYRDADTRYKINGCYCNGYFDTDVLGFIKKEGSPESHRFWFWEGVLLKNEDCFDYLDSLAEYLGGSTEDVMNLYPEVVAYLSVFPLILPNVTGNRKAYISTDGETLEAYTGQFQLLFDSYIREYQNGILVNNKVYKHQKEALREVLLLQNKPVDFDPLYSIQ